jgi:phage-related protein
MATGIKPIVWLHGEIKTPPFSAEARIEAGYLLWQLQMGVNLGMPHSRPMPSIGPRCHELRIRDENSTRRVFYRIDETVIVVFDVLEAKKTRKTPQTTIARGKARLRAYDAMMEE